MMGKFITEQMDGEVWKQIKGFEKYYVSNFGRIWSNNQKKGVLLTHPDGCGYYHVRMYINRQKFDKLVHRLVAEAFVENPNGYKEVNHIDEDKNNNSADNLEWCTRKYNNSYGKAGKQRYIKMGITQRYSRNDLKPVECLDTETGMVLHKFKSIAEASRMILQKSKGSFRCVRSNIGSCCNKRKFRDTAYGYKWRFANV